MKWGIFCYILEKKSVMKTVMITTALIVCSVLGGCGNRQDQMDEIEDRGIRPERNLEKAEGDTTVSDEINVTGNAKSGPVEGP
jgi:hypothetical protein